MYRQDKLTSDDNYRFYLEPARDWYVYAFQLTSSNILVKLFPYNSVQNPLRNRQTYHLPSESNWFYLGQEIGEERLYVVASARPLKDLEDTCARYSQVDGALKE